MPSQARIRNWSSGAIWMTEMSGSAVMIYRAITIAGSNREIEREGSGVGEKRLVGLIGIGTFV